MKVFKTFSGLSRKSLVGLSVVSAFSALMEAVALVTLVPLASTIAAGKDSFDHRVWGHHVSLSVVALLLITLSLVVLRGGGQALTSHLGARIASRYEEGQRSRVFAAFVDADWALQSKELGGHLQETITTAVARSTMAVSALCSGIVSIFSLLMLSTFAFLVSPAISLAIAVAIVILFYATRPLSRVAFRYSSAQRALNLAYAHDVNQATGTAKEIKIFNAGAQVKADNDEALRHNRRNRFWQFFLSDLVSAVYQNLALVTVVAGLAALWLFDLGQASSLAAIVLLLIRALSQSQSLQNIYHKLLDATPFVALVNERLETMDAAVEPTGGADLVGIETLAFSQVSFSYLPGETVLRNVSFATRRGESIGIVGPSGAGKSTFVQLLLGLRQPDFGEVQVNGVAVTAFSRGSWFDRIGFVPQEPVLLNSSVGDNIRFYRPGVTQDDIVRAARQAHIHDEIMSWPRGYDTPVGERGADVSGGQRQRLCIARALVRNPDMVVLDEPTSSLDAHSESMIQETMEALRGSVTMFIVAHRLSTLTICDRIMVFSDGVLQAFAERNELARENPYYSDALRLSQLR